MCEDTHPHLARIGTKAQALLAEHDEVRLARSDIEAQTIDYLNYMTLRYIANSARFMSRLVIGPQLWDC